MASKPAEQYLEQIGWGRYNFNVFIQCGVAWMTDMMWSASVAYILDGSRTDFSLTGLQVGLLGACFPFGLMIGAFIWGLTGDRYGRMYAFKTTVCLAAAFSLILTVSFHPAMSAICLFVLGVGMGGELSLGGTVFCEFCPPSKLYLLTRMAIFWGLGGTISALVAFIAILTNTTAISNWRIIVGSGFVIELLCMIFRFSLEETPAFCQDSGQTFRMKKILNNISRKNTENDLFVDSNSRLSVQKSFENKPEENEIRTGDLIKKLFSRVYLRKVLIFALVTNSSAAFAYTSILYFMPVFLSSLPVASAYGIILLQQVLGIPGTIIGSWLVETRLGRKYTIVLSFGIAGVCCFLFYINADIYSVVVSTSIMNLVVVMGYSAVYTITPESFCTEIRNLGVGTANISARVAGVCCPIFTGWLLAEPGGYNVAIALFAVLFGVTALSAILLKETRPKIENKVLIEEYDQR